MCIISGGSTSTLQPADISWNKPFKSGYKELYSIWMSTGQKCLTAAGKMRSPDKLLCLEWVKEAWNSLSTEVVVKSFKVCGIAVVTDGSEDSQIHCLREGKIGAERQHGKLAS